MTILSAARFKPLRMSLAWLLVLLTMAGCANRQLPQPFPTRTPPPFTDSGPFVMPDRWWTAFEDRGLDREVEIALGGNFTLASALQRLRAARAFARREASSLFPQVNGVIGIDSGFGPERDRTTVAWGLDASYQVDVWGRIEAGVEAEQLRASATAADYQAIALTLAAEVARTWFALIEARAQLELLEEQVTTNRTGLELLEERFGRGFVRSADVLRQRQLVESTLEQVVVEQARIEVLEHQLAVLQGRFPQDARYDTGAEFPALPALPMTGLASDLLLRRPDVVRDFLAFQAADRDLAVAITNQYPRIDLTGSVLNIADHPETLFRDWFVSIGGQLVAPLLDGGQRRAEVDRTAAVVAARFNEYGQTILIAFQEVEDNLARERYQVQRLERLNRQVDLAQQASDQLREQYLIGDADYLDVLSAIQAQQRLQRETLSARLELLLFRVGLYLALAGDFDTRPMNPPELLSERPETLPPELPELPELQDLPAELELLPPAPELDSAIDLDE